jgi:hypothetical protein
MYKTLSKYAENKTSQQHIPPIPVLTAICSDVRLWLAYEGRTGKTVSLFDSNAVLGLANSTQQMICIWRGDVREVAAVIQLRVILDNLHTWAMRCLRPRLERYLDQWEFRHMPSSETTAVPPLDKGDPGEIRESPKTPSLSKNKLPAKATQEQDSPKPEMEVTPALEKILEEMMDGKLEKLRKEIQRLRKELNFQQSQGHCTIEPSRKPSQPAVLEDQQNIQILGNTKHGRPETQPVTPQRLSPLLTPPTTPLSKISKTGSSPTPNDKRSNVSNRLNTFGPQLTEASAIQIRAQEKLILPVREKPQPSPQTKYTSLAGYGPCETANIH